MDCYCLQWEWSKTQDALWMGKHRTLTVCFLETFWCYIYGGCSGWFKCTTDSFDSSQHEHMFITWTNVDITQLQFRPLVLLCSKRLTRFSDTDGGGGGPRSRWQLMMDPCGGTGQWLWTILASDGGSWSWGQLTIDWLQQDSLIYSVPPLQKN